jgi:UDP-2-acetamido-3-amino-2,3-dideoxy-glucuronate N-acetyltransferase
MGEEQTVIDRDDVEVAVLGCGGWGINHVRVWNDLGRLAIVCDPDPRRLADVAELLPAARRVSDPDEVFASDVAGVVIATPATTHADLALDAIDAGKDVLVEKPLAVDVADAEKVADLAAARERILMVGHVLEYHPAILALRRLIDDGALGKILYLYSNRLNFGRVRTEENALWSFAPHDVALLLRLMGEAPEEVAVRGAVALNDGVADTSLMSLRFSKSVPAHVFVSWLHPFKEHRFVVVGDRQMAVFDDTAPWEEKLLLYPNHVDWVGGKVPMARKAEAMAVPLEPAEPLRAECTAFVDAIASREPPLTDGTSGLAVLRVLAAGQRSLDRGGEPVTLERTEAPGFFAHPSATVDDGARIGAGSRVWHHAHVMGGSRIGRDCVVGQNAFVASDVRVGNGVKIQNNVSLYDGVELEDFVFCGPSVVFTNVANPRSEIDRRSEFARTIVRRGATLGANCTVVCGHSIGRYAFVGAGAVVTSDVPDHALVVGVPARQVGWMCSCGLRLDDPEDGAACDACGRRFAVVDEHLIEVDA